jgi:nitrate/nitrite transporter NarK
VGVPWALLVMPMVDSGDVTLFAVAIGGLFALDGAVFGPVTAFVPELFPTRYRYTGTALSVNVAGVIGGAVPPLIADPLLEHYGSWAIGLMMATLALVSLLATYLLPETNGIALFERVTKPAQLACSSALSAMP